MSYKCNPTSRKSLREYALYIRKALGCDSIYFPIVEFLELLPWIYPELTYSIVESTEMPDNIHADIDVLNKVIRIKEKIYDGACDGNGRDRFTIAHEIGHFLLMSEGGVSYAKSTTKPKAYEDPEWQADAFAGELLVPIHKLKRYKKATTVAKRCGVSLSCAEFMMKIKNN